MSLTTPSTAPRPTASTVAGALPGLSPKMAGARLRYERDGKVVASPAKLLVLLYERLDRDLDEAETALRSGSGNARATLVHAQEIVDALDVSLDRSQWSGAEGLGAIYQHLYSELVSANVDSNADIAASAERVAACRDLVTPLLDAWRQAAVTPAPVP